MQRDLHNEVETLTIEDGSFIIQGRPSQRSDMQKKTLKSMVERVFRTQMEGKQITEAVIQIGPSFKKDLTPADVEGFDSMLKQALFHMEGGSGKANGCLSQSPMHTPSMTGCVIYLNADPDLSDALGRLEKAGGKVTMPKTGIGPNGFMAFFVDTEGNQMAMHSNK